MNDTMLGETVSLNNKDARIICGGIINIIQYSLVSALIITYAIWMKLISYKTKV